MSILTFKGGVHPYDGKELSKDVAVRKVNPGKEVVIPVSQHIGAPAVPVIEIGDVDVGTGNIDFVGDVVIHGSVKRMIIFYMYCRTWCH